MIVGAVIIVFGLCMLAYYTPDDVGSLFDTYQMNGSAGFASAGATSAPSAEPASRCYSSASAPPTSAPSAPSTMKGQEARAKVTVFGDVLHFL